MSTPEIEAQLGRMRERHGRQLFQAFARRWFRGRGFAMNSSFQCYRDDYERDIITLARLRLEQST